MTSNPAFPPQPALLTISGASKLLGVSEPTLRQWTDSGELKAFITPGGHRRYTEADLWGLIRSKQGRENLGRIVAVMKEVAPKEHELVKKRLLTVGWYSGLSKASRQELRVRGARLMDLIIRFVTHPSLHRQAEAEAEQIGTEYGAHLMSLGLRMSEAIEAFVMHRAPLLDAASRLIKGKAALSKDVRDSLLQISTLTDRVLLSLIEAYEKDTIKEAKSRFTGTEKST